ncbi:MAG: tetratricopeptide repeat protein [Deltaproteobacteria bacterium]|nr:tetratricopeptide repeat protein [Deltaproteobacteria bacterium]
MRKNFYRLLLLPLVFFIVSSCQQDEGKRMFSDAKQLWELNKYDEAIQNFIALTKAFPEHQLVDDSLFFIAKIYDLYLNEPDQAIRFYRSLSKKFERSEFQYPTMLNLARIYSNQGDVGKRKAVLIYLKIQKETTPDENWAKNQLKLANLYLDLKRYELARVETKRLIISLPQSKQIASAYHLIGQSYNLEGNKELAILAFSEADQKFDYSRTSLPSAISLADIYEEIGQFQSAITVYKSIITRLNKSEVFYQLAMEKIDKLVNRQKRTNT